MGSPWAGRLGDHVGEVPGGSPDNVSRAPEVAPTGSPGAWRPGDPVQEISGGPPGKPWGGTGATLTGSPGAEHLGGPVRGVHGGALEKVLVESWGSRDKITQGRMSGAILSGRSLRVPGCGLGWPRQDHGRATVTDVADHMGYTTHF